MRFSTDPSRRRTLLLLIVLILVTAGLFFYFRFDPDNAVYPKCPVKHLTGLDCPGCGSQRGIRALLHGNIAEAWRLNPLMVIAIPYILIGVAAEFPGRKYRWLEWVRMTIYGAVASWTVLGVVVIFTVFRNVF